MASPGPPKARNNRDILKIATSKTTKNRNVSSKLRKQTTLGQPVLNLFSGSYLFAALFPSGPRGRKIQKMIPPRLELDPQRQQYNTGPNDTPKTYMPILRRETEHISFSNSTLTAWLWLHQHIAKWKVGGAPPEGAFN